MCWEPKRYAGQVPEMWKECGLGQGRRGPDECNCAEMTAKAVLSGECHGSGCMEVIGVLVAFFI